MGMRAHHNMLLQTALMQSANQTHKVALCPPKRLPTNGMHDFHGIQLLIVFLRLSKMDKYGAKNMDLQQDNPLILKNKIQP
jgi:hypothetical protein